MREIKEPTLFWTSEHRLVAQYAGELVYTQCTPSERIQMLQQWLLDLGGKFDDKACCGILELLREVYRERIDRLANSALQVGDRKLWRSFVAMGFDAEYANYLMDVFWELPHEKEVREWREKVRTEVVLLETRKEIVRLICAYWGQVRRSDVGARRPPDEGLKAFYFLNAVLGPRGPVNHEVESTFEIEGRKRSHGKADSDAFQAIVREHVAGTFNLDSSEVWLQERCTSPEMFRVLGMNRAKCGGTGLTRRDMRNDRLLEPLVPEKRSDAAIGLSQKLLEQIKRLEHSADRLLGRMKPEKGWDSDERHRKIGESERVIGNTSVEYPDLHTVNLSVELPSDCGQTLAQDITGRVRRHVAAWLSERDQSVVINFSVAGGKDGFSISESKQFEQVG